MTRITKDMKTPWFPANVHPHRPGVYRVTKRFGACWAHWNGKTWSHGRVDSRAQQPSYYLHNGYAYPVLSWRGLNKQV